MEINELNMVAPINKLSYGLVSFNILKELCSRDIRVNLFPIGNISEYEPEWRNLIQTAVNNQEDFHPAAPSLRIWHQFDLAMHVGKGKHIGYPIFELDTFTNREYHHLSYCDKIFVCSEWAKNIVIKNLTSTIQPESYIKKITHVVPLGVDTQIFKPGLQQKYKPNFIFLNIGKWEIRKGHDVLLEAFNKAFEPKDNVELWMMPTNVFIDNEPWRKMYKESKLGAKIDILGRVNTQAEIAQIMQYADCGVFPSRAEGWNLPLLEMMACGKRVITTMCTAHTEFINPVNSYPIIMDELEPAQDGIWFNGQGNWYKFGEHQVEQLVEYMRFAYKTGDIHSIEQKKREENALQDASRFTWKNTVDKLLAAI